MRRLLATLSIIPSFLQAIIMWVIMLPMMLWQVPKENYTRIMCKGMVLAKVRKNENGTYTISYHGKTKTLTEEEFKKKCGGDIEEK